MKKFYRLISPNGASRELDQDALEADRDYVLKNRGCSLEELGYKIEGPILSREDTISLLNSWIGFAPAEGPQLAMKTLAEFIENGDITLVEENQKALANLFTFIKTCKDFVKDIEPIMVNVLRDCASSVSRTFSISPGARYEKCTDVNVFLKMCSENEIRIEDACKVIFSSISMKKSTELLKMSPEKIREQYSFTVQQNKERIKLL